MHPVVVVQVDHLPAMLSDEILAGRGKPGIRSEDFLKRGGTSGRGRRGEVSGPFEGQEPSRVRVHPHPWKVNAVRTASPDTRSISRNSVSSNWYTFAGPGPNRRV